MDGDKRIFVCGCWTNAEEYRIIEKQYAGMAELADAPDLGSGVPDVQVQVLLPAPTLFQVFV